MRISKTNLKLLFNFLITLITVCMCLSSLDKKCSAVLNKLVVLFCSKVQLTIKNKVFLRKYAL